MNTIRALVVDDSALMRKMIPQILQSDSSIQVVGTAMDGLFALKKISDLKPDVITLDVNMPRMNGLEALRHIVQDHGIPVIIVSSLTSKDAELTFQALESGAFDFVTKPQDAISVHINEIGEELIQKIKAAYDNPCARMKIRRIDRSGVKKDREVRLVKQSAERLLVIGSSTGGPNVLSYLLPRLPKDFPAAIAITQHMPAGFTEMFATRLNSLSQIEVKEASDGDLVLPGRALIAPGDKHMKVKKLPLGSIVVLSDLPPVNGHRPSVDVLFGSAAAEYGKNATALIMTGMGIDGAEGTGEVMRRGGLTIAQDEDSCIVFGMPKAAIERNYIREVVDLDKMDGFLIKLFSKKEENYGTTSH